MYSNSTEFLLNAILSVFIKVIATKGLIYTVSIWNGLWLDFLALLRSEESAAGGVGQIDKFVK